MHNNTIIIIKSPGARKARRSLPLPHRVGRIPTL
jgi:hypothetical protein